MEQVLKTCYDCNVEKPIDCFRSRKDSLDGHRGNCKDCQDRSHLDYRATLNGCITQLLSDAKSRCRKRSGEAAQFELGRKEIENMWEKQQGLCYYSNIPMTFKDSWKVSLERLDQNLGYTKDNTVLICFEFQNQCNWSHDKITEMLSILDQNITSNFVSFEANTTRKKPEKTVLHVINGINHYHCNYCRVIKSEQEFKVGLLSMCNCCSNSSSKSFKETPRGRIKRLVDMAKTRVKRVGQSRKYMVVDINFEFLVKLYNDQKGLCAYSGLPLKFGNYDKNNWLISLERKDVFKGYEKENVCLICIEFQATDYSVVKRDKPESSLGWTKDKFQLFRESVSKPGKYIS